VVEAVSEAFNFLASCLNFPENMTSHAIKIPLNTERNMTIARDASNFHKRKETATGEAFCTEKIVTTAIIINKSTAIILSQSPPFSADCLLYAFF